MKKRFEGLAGLLEFKRVAKVGMRVEHNINAGGVMRNTVSGVINKITPSAFIITREANGGGNWSANFVPYESDCYVIADIWCLVAKGQEIKTKEKNMLRKSKEDNKISIDIIRENGRTVFSFQVPSYLENIYKARSEEIKESEKWEGLRFYSIPAMTRNEDYKEALRSSNLVDDYGTAILTDGRLLNIAWLRTVGGKGEIVISDDVSLAQMNNLMKSCMAFLKNYFTDFLQDFNIKGSICIEI